MNKHTASQSGGLCENPEGETAATLFAAVSLVRVELGRLH